MGRFQLAYRNSSIIIPPDNPVEPELSDLVTLGILPKEISQFTIADIGTTIISVPYTDESEMIQGPIEFEVVGVNHHRDINDETKPTITLMSKNILRKVEFDAKEDGNPNVDREEHGNNRWSVSNIRQWLNSDGEGFEWFVPQHEYDALPGYATDPGFLAGFSQDFKQHLATVKNRTILCDSDKSSLDVDFEETEDKVFLPSYTEMGFGNLDDNNPEGTWLSNKFPDYDSKMKQYSNGKKGWYWMRSPDPGYSEAAYAIYEDGTDGSGAPSGGGPGVVPLLVLC